jgi:hypothetical protein
MERRNKLQVIRMSRATPPAGSEKLGSAGSLEEFEICPTRHCQKNTSPNRSRYSLFGFLPFLKSFFSPLASLNIKYPDRFTRNTAAVHTGPSSTGLNTKYLAWREYTKGTHARSPTESINPKPSVVMSIVVNMAGCNEYGVSEAYQTTNIDDHTSLYNPSATYQLWKASTSHIESVIFLNPPRRTACSHAMLMLIRTHKMRPGLSSLNDFISRYPIEGLSSRPIKN